jgi:hypothetical protein
MLVDNKFEIGNIVYCVCDIEQLPRIITAITLRANGYIEYECSYGTSSSVQSQLEISTQKTIY